MTRKQAGFTLIELVVVITILGILAAFALPRFANVESQARTASINGLAGGMRAVVALAHAQWLVDGATAGADVDILMEGNSVRLDFGWPEAGSLGIEAAMQDLSSYTINGNDYELRTGDVCQVTYTGPTATTSPVIATTTTGC